MFTVTLVNINIKCFLHTYAFSLFLSTLSQPTGQDKICRYYICLWVSACTLLINAKAESAQRELLRAENFWRLSAETADGSLWWYFLYPGRFSKVPKSTWDELFDSYLLGMLRHSKKKNLKKSENNRSEWKKVWVRAFSHKLIGTRA